MPMFIRLVVVLLCVVSSARAQSDYRALKLMPNQPAPGQQVAITYNPKDTKLANESTVEATAFALNGDGNEAIAIAIPLAKDGTLWKGTFVVPEKTLALAFGFTNGDKRSDNNEEKSYASYLYKNGSIIPGSRAALGDWYGGSSYLTGLDPDKDRARALFRDEFQANPAMKRKFVGKYIWTFNRRLPADKVTMEAEAVELASQPNLTADELGTLSSIYESIGKKEEAKKYGELLHKKDPNAGDALYMAYRRFGAANDVATKKAILDSIRTRFAGAKNLPSFDGYLTGGLARAYVDAGKLDEADKLANMPAHTATVMQAYNSLAWDNAQKDTNLVVSARLSKRATDWAKSQLDMPAQPATAAKTGE